MEYKFNLTEKVKDFITEADVSEIGIGCSDSQVIKIEKENNVFFLKIAILGVLTS